MTTKTQRRLRGGMIGLGFMGRHHVGQYEKLPQVELVAIADADPVRLHNKATIEGNIDLPQPKINFAALQAFADGRDLIAQADVDFVDIATPSYLHAEMAVLAAEAGRHILVEKPMALNSADAERMIAAARANNVRLMVAQVVRFWPEYLYLKEVYTSKRLGRLMHAEFIRRGSRPRWSWRKWMSEVEHSGGAPFDLHIHDVDYVHYLLGEPQKITARHIVSPGSTGHDIMTAQFEYPDGLTVAVDGGWYAPARYGFYSAYEAVFEQGIVRYHGGAQPTLTVMRNDTDEVETPSVSGDPYEAEILFFVRALQDGSDPAEQHPPESSLAAVRLIERELASA
ncbi:MAG: Inositol 2-dehydrogenase [Chloroflexi bacterium ADurb.Bin325]|nr:MAG: Inositol 2-dehydrogenase [Chloroflexi bacterium ADurb.Bin325]